jgi:hypothetical protein
MRGVVRVIWVNPEAEYFYRTHWTKPMRDLPVGQRDR